MGDLLRMDFMDAWLSPKLLEVRSANLRGDVADTVCEQCVSCELEHDRALGRGGGSRG
jgi:hypothetical protein